MKSNKIVETSEVGNTPTVWEGKHKEAATKSELAVQKSLEGKKRVEKTIYKKIGKKTIAQTVWVYV